VSVDFHLTREIALSHGLGNKAGLFFLRIRVVATCFSFCLYSAPPLLGNTLPLFNEAIALKHSSWRIVLVKRRLKVKIGVDCFAELSICSLSVLAVVTGITKALCFFVRR
jgi:hypothetical protein